MPSQRDSEPHTSEKNIKRHEYDTIHKSWFFELFDSHQNGDSLRQICKNPQINIPPSTGHRWLNERDHLGDKAFRGTRKISKRLGRKCIIATATLDDLLRKDNPLNTKPYELILKNSIYPSTNAPYNTTLQLEKELGDTRSLGWGPYLKKLRWEGSI